MMIEIDHYASTDVGKVRKENQDSYGVLGDRNLYIVCDGMGGGAAGDFASHCATDIMLKSFEELAIRDVSAVAGKLPVQIDPEYQRPIAAIRLANRALFNFTQKYPKLTGMGTTVVAVLFDLAARRLHIYHAGDSRLYRIRNGAIEQLTKDHSKVNELLDQGKMKEDDVKTAEIQSMITRALGTAPKVRIDYRSVEVLPDDTFIMCTDGLNGEISDDAIRDMVLKHPGDMKAIATGLIDAANSAAGRDNTTVIALSLKNADFGGDITYPIPTQPVITLSEEEPEQLALEDSLLRSIISRAKIKVPKSAIEKGLLNNPLALGLVLAALIVGVAFFPKKVVTAPDTKLTDLAGQMTGIELDVRSPSEAQLVAFRRAEDSVQRLQVIQDWFKNKENLTRPLEGVSVTVLRSGKQEFSGVTGRDALNIELQVGSCSVRVARRNFRAINERMGFVTEIPIAVEPSESFKNILVIMIPVNE